MFNAILLLAEVQQSSPLVGDKGMEILGIAIGLGLICIGASKGIGQLASSAMEAIARQPDAGGRIGTNMIIAAALIEGFTFFALLVQYLALPS